MVIGLKLAKSFSVYGGDAIDVEFWRPGLFTIDPTTLTGTLKWIAYKDKAYFLSNGPMSYYPPSAITFRITPSNWPFVPGTDPMGKFWAFVKTFNQIADSEGNELNGGLDWSTATDETLP